MKQIRIFFNDDTTVKYYTQNNITVIVEKMNEEYSKGALFFTVGGNYYSFLNVKTIKYEEEQQ